MITFIKDLDAIIQASKLNAVPVLKLLGVLWGIHIVNFSLGYRLNYLGLLPRSVSGALFGIPLMVVLHADFGHLFANSIPFFILVNMVVLKGWPHFWTVTVYIIGLSGLAVWLVGRRALHIGASGLNMGYMGYMLADVYFHPSSMAIILGALSLYYLGTMLVGVIPLEARESWEGHLFGLLAGISVAYWPIADFSVFSGLLPHIQAFA